MSVNYPGRNLGNCDYCRFTHKTPKDHHHINHDLQIHAEENYQSLEPYPASNYLRREDAGKEEENPFGVARQQTRSNLSLTSCCNAYVCESCSNENYP